MDIEYSMEASRPLFGLGGPAYNPHIDYFSQLQTLTVVEPAIPQQPDVVPDDNHSVVDLTMEIDEPSLSSFQPTQTVCVGRVQGVARVRKIPVFPSVIRNKTPILSVSIRQSPIDEFICEILQGGNVIGELSVTLSRVLILISKRIGQAQVGKNWHLNKLETKLQSKHGTFRLNQALNETIKWDVEIHLNIPAGIAEYAIERFNTLLDGALLPPTTTRYTAFQQSHREVMEEEARDAKLGSKFPSLAEQTRSVRNFMSNHTSSVDLPTAETPSGLRTALMHHQKQALRFMREKEHEINSLWTFRGGKWHHDLAGFVLDTAPIAGLGGIIADDMGLGKTLSIISLILSTRTEAFDFGQDVTVSKPMGATLVIVPKSLLDAGWSSQIAQHVEEDALSVLKWFGPGRTADPNEFRKVNVVLTTYGQVQSDARRQTPVLQMFNWFRIVLDEAHVIRNPEGFGFITCKKLEAKHRWAITGTPIQNTLDDFGSLLRFLRIQPFRGPKVFNDCVRQWTADHGRHSDPIKTLVDSITIRRTKQQLYQGNGIPEKSNEPAEVQLSPRERDRYQFLEEELRIKLKTAQQLKKKCAYRIDGDPGGYLRHLTKIRLFLAHKEELMKEEDLARFHGLRSCPIVVEDAVFETRGMNEEKAIALYERLIDETENYCHICSESINMSDEPEDEEDTNDEGEMIGCVTSCAFALCPKCAAEYSEDNFDDDQPHEFPCTLCAENHWSSNQLVFELLSGAIIEKRRRQEEMRKSHLATVAERYSGPSAKVRFLLEKLKSFKELDIPGEKPNKAVVFTAWSLNLDCIEIAMQRNGFKYVRLDGRMGSVQRRNAIDTFEKDPEVTVFMATIGSGGVGINLVAGNHVFIMEPQWNPQAEEQAIDRVHRIGQTRPVKVYRLITVDTFEKQIRDVAKAKLKLANGTLQRADFARNWQRKMLDARFERQNNVIALESGSQIIDLL
jgi:SNF2 family DNA or RNA helicase